jgi:hypothetical protein
MFTEQSRSRIAASKDDDTPHDKIPPHNRNRLPHGPFFDAPVALFGDIESIPALFSIP